MPATEFDDVRLQQQARSLAAVLLNRNLRLATAESCTGGWIAKICTDLAGSSAWFERGFVCYSNAAKSDLLAVSESLVSRFGAVSQEVAEAMARGASQRSEADVSIAVTGIAGPDGGTPDKPVGLVWFGWCLPVGQASVECSVFEGDREQVRRAAVYHALAGMQARLE